MMQKLISARSHRLPIAPLVTAGLIALSLPAAPAQAGLFGNSGNPYQTCAKDLLNAKIASEAAAEACAEALHPDDLAACVTRISGAKEVNVAAPDALTACKQVRRPIELASCVVDIRQTAKEAPAADVLGTCRRSLLPVRFASCVVGLHGNLKLSAQKSMDQCIDATDRPQDLESSLLPLDFAAPTFSTPPTTNQPGGFTPNTAPLPNIPTTLPNK
jgi:hypothetical protein